MLAYALSVFSLAILGTELYFGVVVVSTQGDELFVERAKAPAKYWVWMSLHIVVGVGIPILGWLAGI